MLRISIIKKYRVYIFLEHLLVISLILNCHSVYQHGLINLHFDVLSCLLLIFMVLCGNEKIGRQSFITIGKYIIFIIPVTIQALRHSNYILSFFAKYVLFAVCMFVAFYQNTKLIKDLIRIFTNIMLIICIISLIFYFLSTILHIIPSSGDFTVNWGSVHNITNYFGIYFESSRGSLFGYENSAIFTESPVFDALICTATTFHLFYIEEKPSKGKSIIFYLSILTTFGTMGYIYILLSFVGILYIHALNKKTNKHNKLILICALLAVLPFASVVVLWILWRKSQTGYSFLLRSDDLMIALRVLKEHPILGVGFGDNNYFSIYANQNRIHWSATGGGQSSDFAYLIASGGSYFMLFYITSLWKGIKQTSASGNNIVLFLLILYILLISRIGATLLMLSIVFCSAVYIFENNKWREYE